MSRLRFSFRSELNVRSKRIYPLFPLIGLYDIVIAADELASTSSSSSSSSVNTNKSKKDRKQERQKTKAAKEFGVSRGIDFQNVANVINFDFPPNLDSYIHRVGRTARADNKGLGGSSRFGFSYLTVNHFCTKTHATHTHATHTHSRARSVAYLLSKDTLT